MHGMPQRRPGLWLLLWCLLISLFLSALDSTIIATALPTIVGDLGGLDHIAWVFTAYLLTSTVSVPLFGKISDIYGRRRVFQTTIVIFLAGSMLSGISATMNQLILFRGIQGVGGGGLLAMTFTILGDILSPRERPKYMGYFTGVFAAASVIGPLIGGFFVDTLTWRWVFYVNIPFGIVALIVTAKYLNLPDPSKRRPIDFLGSVLFAVAVTTLLLGATWGGTEYAWASPTIVGLFATGVLFSALFLLQERRAKEPLLPLRMFKNDIFSVAIVMSVLFGSVMVVGSVFLPLFLQIVRGVSATSSGFLLVPMMMGVLVGSTYGGRLITKTGRYKAFPLVGGAMCITGIGMLATIDVDTTRAFVSIGMCILGLGIGTASPVLTLAVQNVAARGDMGAATSAVNFFRSLGSAFGVSIFGAIHSARLHAVLDARLPKGTAIGDSILNSPKSVLLMPPPVRHAIQEAVASGVAIVFQCALPIIILAFLVSFLLREIPLGEGVNIGSAAIEGMEEAGFGILGEPAPGGMDDGHNDQRDGNLATVPSSPDRDHPARSGNGTSRAQPAVRRDVVSSD
jgi:EmrB/QacA subfamily drug resistance transporter